MVILNRWRLLIFLGAFILSLSAVTSAQESGADELYHASRVGDVDFAKELLAAGVDPNAASADGRYPVMAAAERGRAEILQLLIEAGANVNQPDTLGRTALFLAVKRNRLSLIGLLVGAGADINHQDQSGETPLMLAVRSRNEAAVELILSLGPDLARKNTQGKTALDLAVSGSAENVTALIRRADARGAGVSPKELSDGLNRGQFHLALDLLEDDLGFDVKSEQGYQLLTIAIKHGAYDVARKLIRIGAAVNSAQEKKRQAATPLTHAILAGKLDLAQELLEAGADVNQRYFGDQGYTPLMIAATMRNLAMVELLVRKGADLDAVMDVGPSAYHLAASRGNAEIVDYLISAGATPPGYWYDRGAATGRSGLYALEVLIDFDVLKGVKFDPANKTLSLFGDYSKPEGRQRLPYVDYLATAYRIDPEGFSLESQKVTDNKSLLFAIPGFFSDVSTHLDMGLGLPVNGLVSERERYFQFYGVPSGEGNWLGMHYRDIWDGVRVWRLAPNRAAARAGIQRGDLIVGLDGYEILSKETLTTYVDSRQPGSRVEVRLLRNGVPLSFSVEVEALTSTKGMSRLELLAFVFRGLNEVKKALLVEWLDCGAGEQVADLAGDQGLENIKACTSAALTALQLQETSFYGGVQGLLDLVYQELGAWSYRLEVRDLTDYPSLLSKVNKAVMELHQVHPTKFFDPPDAGAFLLDNPQSFANKLAFEDLVYYPESYRFSLLGRSMFESDARLKRTLGWPMDEFELPGFPINDFLGGFTAYGSRRWWIHPARISFLENAGEGEIWFENADIVIGAEDYKKDEVLAGPTERRSFKSAYSEYHREAITASLARFAGLYPEIHDGFEAVKTVVLSRQLRGRYNLAFYLPGEGQGTWKAPMRWVERDFGGVSLRAGDVSVRRGRTPTPRAPQTTPHSGQIDSLREAPRDIRQRLMSGIRAPEKLDPAGSVMSGPTDDGLHAPRSSVSVKTMVDAVDYARKEALKRGVSMLRGAAEQSVAVFSGAPKSSLDAARTSMEVGEGASQDVVWTLEDVSDAEQTRRRAEAAPWRTVDRLLPGLLPECMTTEEGC